MVVIYSLESVMSNHISMEASKKLINVLGIFFLDFKRNF